MFIVDTVIDPVFQACLYELIIQKFLLQIGLLDTDADRIAEIINNTGTFAHKTVMVCIEFKEVRTDVPQSNHSLNHSRFYLYIHAPFRQPGDMAAKGKANLILHKLHKFVLDACSLSLSSNDFSLGCILAEL